MLIEPSKTQEWLSVDRTTNSSARAEPGPHLAPRGQCAEGPQGAGGHLWFLLPLAISLGTGESSFLVALETWTISSPSHEVTFFQYRRIWGKGFPTLCQRSVESFSSECQRVSVSYPVIMFASCQWDGLIAWCLARLCGVRSELNSSSWRAKQRRHLYNPFTFSLSPPTCSY